MARQLASSVIDVQLQQLRENGLSKDPWYAEIDGMRKHLDVMIAAEMPEVIALLAKVDKVGQQEKQQVFAEARQKSRQILVRLIVERQTLLRRLRMAELVAQVEQLIVVQSKVRDATEALPEQPEARRPAMNLTAIEDQRDMHAAARQFTQGLVEVSQWTGPFGEEAQRGLEILDKNKVDAHLLAAEGQLQAAQFAGAAADQKAVIEGLKAVLAELRQFQRMADKDAGRLAEKIKEALAKQEEIRKETEEAKPDSPELRQLEDKQLEVRKEIAVLAETAASPEVKKTLETAKNSAEEARNELFKQQPDRAAAKQEDVVANLDQALKSTEANAPPASSEKTAEGMKKPLTDAERKQLDETVARLSKAASDLDKAAEAEKNVAKESQAAAEKQGMSSAEAKALDEKHENAEQTAKQVGEDIQNEAPEAAKTIGEAQQPMQEAGKRLDTAKDQPGEPSKPAAAEAGKQAGTAAKLLEKASEQVRSEIQKAEAELANLPALPAEAVDAALREAQRELGQPQDPTPGQPVVPGEKTKAKPTGMPPATKPEPATPDSTADAATDPKQLLDQPWTAKLPPELRSAIRSNSNRRPPRGYQERLQRYYENME